MIGSELSWHRFVVIVNEPITVAVVITFVGGFFLQHIVHSQDQRKARRELGYALVVEMTGCAYGIYHRLQKYYRNPTQITNGSLGLDLEDAYSEFRGDAAVIQTKLESLFYVNRKVYIVQANKEDRDKDKRVRPIFVSNSEPWTFWHGVIDLITLDYNYLLETTVLDDVVVGVTYHIGFTDEDLIDHSKMMVQFTEYLRLARESVIKESLKRRRRKFTPSRLCPTWRQ
jgi:hypothetical protein